MVKRYFQLLTEAHYSKSHTTQHAPKYTRSSRVLIRFKRSLRIGSHPITKLLFSAISSRPYGVSFVLFGWCCCRRRRWLRALHKTFKSFFRLCLFVHLFRLNHAEFGRLFINIRCTLRNGILMFV